MITEYFRAINKPGLHRIPEHPEPGPRMTEQQFQTGFPSTVDSNVLVTSITIAPDEPGRPPTFLHQRAAAGTMVPTASHARTGRWRCSSTTTPGPTPSGRHPLTTARLTKPVSAVLSPSSRGGAGLRIRGQGPFTSRAAVQASRKPLVQPAERQRVELARQLLVVEMAARQDVNFVRFAVGKRSFPATSPVRPGRRQAGAPCAAAGNPARRWRALSLVSFVQPEKAPGHDMVGRRQDPAAVPGLQELWGIRGIKGLPEDGCGRDRRRRPSDGVKEALNHLVGRAVRGVDQHEARDEFRVPDGER